MIYTHSIETYEDASRHRTYRTYRRYRYKEFRVSIQYTDDAEEEKEEEEAEEAEEEVWRVCLLPSCTSTRSCVSAVKTLRLTHRYELCLDSRPTTRIKLTERQPRCL